MSEESDIDGQIEESRKRGNRTSSASVSSHDPRVSTGIAWIMGILGTIAVLTGAWVATSINTLNVNVARLVEKLEAKESRDSLQDARISKAEDRVEDLTGDVRTLEGKNLRGGPSAH